MRMVFLKRTGVFKAAVVAAGLLVFTGNSATASFEDGVKAYESGNYEDAIKQWTPLAQANDTAAMRNLGHMYRRGLGVPMDAEQAVRWYRRAAERGFARAQANLASMYLKGEGVSKDAKKATEWFILAARGGHVISQYNLGLIYESGLAGAKDPARAMAWYNLAAKAGHPRAMEKLSMLVVKNPTLEAGVIEESAAKPAAAAQAELPKVSPEQARLDAQTSTTAPTVKPEAVRDTKAEGAADTAAKDFDKRAIEVKRETEIIVPKPEKIAPAKAAQPTAAQVSEVPKATKSAASLEGAAKSDAPAAKIVTPVEAPASESASQSAAPQTVTQTAARPAANTEAKAKTEEGVTSSPTIAAVNGVSVLSIRERAERQLAGLQRKVKARNASAAVQEALPTTKIQHDGPSGTPVKTAAADTPIAAAPAKAPANEPIATTPPTETAPAATASARVKPATDENAPAANKPEEKKQVSLFAALSSLFKQDGKPENQATPGAAKSETPAARPAGGEQASGQENAPAKAADTPSVAVKPVETAIVAAPETVEKPEAAATTSRVEPVAAAPQKPAPPAGNAGFDASAISGNGLTLDERLEMASLSYELEDFHQALVIWMPLANAGHPGAQYHVGTLFRQGRAVPVDRKRAHFWLSKSKRGGNAEAAEMLAVLETSMTEMELRQARRLQ